MTLNNIAMVAADTTRTKLYLTELIKNNLLPSYILLLLTSNGKMLPGQKDLDTKNELISCIVNAGIKYDIASNNDINSDGVIKKIESRSEEVFIFSGYGGVLLNSKILGTNKKFLHIHGGYLPKYKGSTTNYYSLIEDNEMGASAIFLTKKIDCGPILLRKKFPAPKDRSMLDHVTDSAVRATVLIQCLQNYISSGTWDFEVDDNDGGETFYIIHPVLKHLSIMRK
ncbi:formyltransferase family protein [Planktomarina sp.]|nr:formyltransferase family protein [Planktomarina sp.]